MTYFMVYTIITLHFSHLDKAQNMKLRSFLLPIVLAPLLAQAQQADFSHVAPVKNVILMISDGTSISSVSLARWYNRIIDPEAIHLNLDPHLSGTILTYCSDAPIGDSAPTSSTYVNGMPSQAGFVNSYPVATDHDLVPVDPKKAYRPLVTAFELSHILRGKKTGIVVTCEFPHATPADMTAHYYRRKAYNILATQMAQNEVDVLYGGGVKLATPEIRDLLKKDGIKLYTDDKSALTAPEERVWGLFGQASIPYDIDRDPALYPSMEEMTRAAIEKLDHNNPQGFFLMVEGSKVDWAAHANDPVGIASEFSAFDKAIGAALDFAKKDGNTVVIVTSDHGNSGLALGRRDMGGSYAKAPASDLFGILTKAKKSAVGLAELLLNAKSEKELPCIFETYAGFTPTPSELKVVTALRKIETGRKKGISDEAEDKLEDLFGDDKDVLALLQDIMYSSNSLDGYIAALYTHHTRLAFTTFGHTAEEVFLACYAPKSEARLMGMNTNIDLNNYIRALTGLTGKSMEEYTDEYFAPASELFSGLETTITGKSPEEKTLTVRKGNRTLVARAYSDTVTIDGKTMELPLAVVYVDKTNDFYLPASLKDF